MSLLVESDVVITCPECGATRIVSARQRRRILNGIHNQRCFWCRTGHRRLHPERHLRFWLEYAGVCLPKGTDPHAWVEANGVPQVLLDLAAHMGLDELLDEAA